MGDEHEVAAPHLLGVPADVLLLLRLQIVGLPDGIAVGLRRQALGLVKADGGYVLRIGQLRTQQGQLSGVFLPEQGHKAAQKALLQRHQVGKGVEKAHLQIQGGIFVQVPLGGVLLRPEHRADLIHPLKHPHHGLLVELGGLGQHSFPAEIVQPELAGASLGPGPAQLGGVDLGKALPLEKLPEGPADGRLDAEHRPGAGGAEGHRAEGELRVQAEGTLFGQGHRRGRGGPGEHRAPGLRQLRPAGRPGFGPE